MKSFNKIGIVIAILFGIVLLFVSAKENSKYKINPKLIADSVLQEADQVKPGDLNEWIIEKNQNYILIDLRTEKEFDEGSIPTAENIPMKELVKKDIVSNLAKDIPLIIYSNDRSHTKRGWIILKKAGLKVFVLDGGYNYWEKYPVLPGDTISEDEMLSYKKDLAAANSLKGIQSSNITGIDIKPVKKKRSKKKRRKKKNKLEGC